MYEKCVVLDWKMYYISARVARYSMANRMCVELCTFIYLA